MKKVMTKGTSVIRGGGKMIGAPLLLKVQFLASPRAVHGAREEDAAHAAISDGSDCFEGFEITGDFVPKFIMGSTVKWSEKGAPVRLRVTLMEYIKGRPLSEVPEKGITPILYARIERAFTMLWIMGYSHNDAHAKNIIVAKGERPYVIDFGFSHKLPLKRRQALRARIIGALHFNDAFDANYFNYLTTYFLGIRENGKYTPDGLLLRDLRRSLSNNCDIFAARKKAWIEELRACGPELETVFRRAIASKKRGC